jgi:hypothetical protein
MRLSECVRASPCGTHARGRAQGSPISIDKDDNIKMPGMDAEGAEEAGEGEGDASGGE